MEEEYEFDFINFTFCASINTKIPDIYYRSLIEKLEEGWEIHHSDTESTNGHIEKVYIIKRKKNQKGISHS